MKILIIASYNKNCFAPFVREQVSSLEQQGCQTEWFGVQQKGIIGYLREIQRLRVKIRECRPDVIHAHYGLCCLLANLATRRVPVVGTYHGSDINIHQIRLFSKMAIRLSAWNIFVSKRIMDTVGAIEGNRCSLIPCGVVLSEDQIMSREEARNILGWNKDSKKVLFAGAFNNPVKDPELAKEVVALLHGVELVELKGYTRIEINRLMCAANCLLMTSKMEGSPQVIKEAMASGCPIVSVDVGDVSERLQGLDGCYVAKTRTPEDIAQLVKNVLRFDGKTNGRARIKESGLTNDQVAKRLLEIYARITK